MPKCGFTVPSAGSIFHGMVAFVDPPRLPVIDFAPFESGGSFRDHVAAQIDWAASEFGFFYIVGHRVDLSAIERLLSLSRTFFLQEPQAKAQLHMSRGGARGAAISRWAVS